jgi:hypothetical protein
MDFEKFDSAFNRFLDFYSEYKIVENVHATQEKLRNIINNPSFEYFNRENIDEFFLGKNADEIAAAKAANAVKENFYIFMEDEKTRKIMKEYLDIRRKYDQGKDLFSALRENLIFKHLETSSFGKSKPKFYVNRMIITIFPEICTTIANFGDLEKAAEMFNIDMDKSFNKAIFNVHYQIRSKVNEYLKAKGLYDKYSEYEKAALAWFLLDK